MSITSAFLSVFSESPFKLIATHMEKSVECVHFLDDFFAKSLAQQWDDARDIQRQIASCESEADVLQRQVNRRVHREMFMPVSRYDLLSLVKSQDHIANQSEDIAGYVLGRRMCFPKAMHADISEFVRSSIAVCDEALHIVQQLDLLRKVGFKGRCIDKIEQLAQRIHHLEHENDLLQVRLRGLLQAEESNLSAVDVVFMYKILERIGNLADCAHSVGEKFTIMLVSL